MKYRGQQVITTKDLALLLKSDTKQIRNIVTHNPTHFVEDGDYLMLTGTDLAEFKRENKIVDGARSNLRIFTRQGADKVLRRVPTEYNPIEYMCYWIQEEKAPETVDQPLSDKDLRIGDLQRQIQMMTTVIEDYRKDKENLQVTIDTLTKVIDHMVK